MKEGLISFLVVLSHALLNILSDVAFVFCWCLYFVSPCVPLRIECDVCVRAHLTKSKETTTGEGTTVPFIRE